MAAPYNVYEVRHSELGSDYSHRLCEPYRDISSVFTSNKTVSIAGKLCWSTTSASCYMGGREWRSCILSL